MSDTRETTLADFFNHLLGLARGRVLNGSGHAISQDRDISNVTGINLTTVGNVYITVGDREALRIEAEDNLLPHLETKVHGGQLDIRTDNGVGLRPTRPINFYVTVKSLDCLTLAGSGNIEAPDVKAEHFQLRLSGHGDVRLGKLNAHIVQMSLSGAGNVHLDRMDAETIDVHISGSAGMTVREGLVKTQRITLSGVGSYDALNMQSDIAQVHVSGNGSINIYVHDRLEARITGVGSVHYAGDPAIEEYVSGMGRVRPSG